LLIAVRGQTETYVKPAALPMYGLRELAAQLIGLSRRLKFAPTSIGGAAFCATAGLWLQSWS
jgi:hypothetical protein